MKTNQIAILIGCLCVPIGLFASAFTFSGYAEGFFNYSLNSDASSKIYPFIYHYPDNRMMNLNHAEFELHTRSDDWFGNIGLHTGRYVDENYGSEPSMLRPLYSASIGKNLSPEWTLEAGIFPSHIGFESAIGKEGWTLSRSLVADNSPYFESGLKTTFTPNEQWSFAALVLNGWQVISDPNSSKSFGTQIQWKPTPEILLNSSTYVGNDQPNSMPGKTRYFHNFFGVFKLSSQWSVATLCDVGVQENGTKDWNTWIGGGVITQYSLEKNLKIGGRLEFFSDPSQVVATGSPSTWSASVNSDFAVLPRILWRNELKTYWNLPHTETMFSTALSWSFEGGF